MNEAAIERLGVEPGRRVLDVGFGGGVTFPALLERGANVAGIDRAGDAVSAVSHAYRDSIDAGRLELRAGEVGDLPFADESFDGVLTVNTIYFWPDLGAGLSEILRVLEPGGRLVVAIRDGASMRRVSRDIFTIRSPGEVLIAIEEVGFADARSESPVGTSYHLLSATRP